MKKEITILKTWKDEIYEFESTVKEYLSMKASCIANGQDGFYSDKYKEYLKFSRFESEKGKTQHILIEGPKEEKEKPIYKMGSTEKKKFQEKNPDLYFKKLKEEEETRKKIKIDIAEAMERSKERRYRDFIEERNIILNKLAEREVSFGVQTTKDQLREYEKIKKETLKNNI